MSGSKRAKLRLGRRVRWLEEQIIGSDGSQSCFMQLAGAQAKRLFANEGFLPCLPAGLLFGLKKVNASYRAIDELPCSCLDPDQSVWAKDDECLDPVKRSFDWAARALMNNKLIKKLTMHERLAFL
ncbi:MAG: hypothetical protein ACI8ZN_002316 [Bacteroidia bacterium]|jgi:hypothetical protein